MKRFILISSLTLLAFSSNGFAETDAEWKRRMEKQIEMLTKQNQRRSLTGPGDGVYKGVRGFAPAASKVYHVPAGVSVGGYGEMVYNNFSSERENGTASGRRDQIDFLRNILYVGFKYNDHIIFNSEIEFEHASTTNGGSRGEVSVELAYLDFTFNDFFGIRTGLLLVPVGIRNELHEPTLFHGVSRPSTESRIIPTTWRDNGAGIFGQIAGFAYRAYVLAGLQAVGDTGGFGGFSASGIRGGRTKGAKSIAEDKAVVARVDYEGIPGLLVGGSVYQGDSGQDITDATGNEIEGTVNLYEVHTEAKFKGAELSALYAKGTVDDVAALNAANGLTGASSIGTDMFGGYISVAFDILSLFDTDHYLAPFFRYERYDTQQEVPTGFSNDPSRSFTELTYGVSYKPHPNVVVKVDVQDQSNQANTGIDSANAGIGFLF